MCPPPVVVVDVLRQDLAKMPFADHDNVVKAFPSNRANHPLGIRVLPRRAGRDDRLPDVQRLGLTRKSLSIDLVSVRRSGPSPSAEAVAGAPSTRRVVAAAPGSPAPTRGACEQSFSVSQRGFRAIGP